MARGNGNGHGKSGGVGVVGVVVDRGGVATFVPADERQAPFALDGDALGGLAALPRGVLVELTESGAGTFDAAHCPALRGNFTAVVDHVDGEAFLRDLARGSRTFVAGGDGLAEGTVVQAHTQPGDGGGVVAVIDAVLAGGGSAEARSWRVAGGLHLDPLFPADALAEAAALLAEAPRFLADEALVDRSGDAFFAIDNAGSKDIDQAMFLEARDGGGFRVHYALADMSAYVRPGTALFREAMARGASFYLPGVSVTMQPRDVCERVVSLNAHEQHRAVIVTVELDAGGAHVATRVTRAKIESRAQLTYPGVTAFLERGAPLDVDEHGRPVPAAVRAQLALFRAIGESRRALARARGVADPARRELRIGLRGATFYMHEVDDDLASALNAELSILVNVAAAAVLTAAAAPAIYRVHPAPTPEKLAALRAQIDEAVAGNGAPASWRWAQDEALAAWVERLKRVSDGDGATPRERELSAALQGLVLGVQVSSEYARVPGFHSGLAVTGYGRFTAPMREVVGIVSHAVLLHVALGAPLWHGIEALCDDALAAGNAARQKQRQCDAAALRLLFDDLFRQDLGGAPAGDPRRPAPLRAATVTAVHPGKVVVHLADPGVDVKLTRDDLDRDAPPVIVGQEVRVRATHHDGDRLHFALVV